MKTVLHMIETGGTGGAETVYVNLVRELDPSRWRHIPVLPTREWMYDELTDFGVRPVLISERRAFDVVFFARMISLIKRHGVDLIHGHLFGSAVRAGLLSRVCGIPAIATLHGHIDLGSRERFQRLKIDILNRGLRRVVFVSEPLRRAVLASVPLRPELTTVIPNGIDFTRFSGGDGSSFRAQFGIAPDEFVVGNVATPGRAAKGLDILLDVAKLLKTYSPGIRFVIVGDLSLGRGTELLTQRDAMGLAHDVVVTGFRQDVANAHAAFDVYALTSRSEGFSLALIEAMASGLPVVSTRCGGPEEIIDAGRTGLLVENGSAEAVAAAIVRLRTSADERQRLGAAARDAVQERFSLDRQVAAYEKVYENAIGIASLEKRHDETPAIAHHRPPRVTVVIPTYNRADFISATVESVIGQTLAPLEVIIVDDGSTDNTSEVCGQFGPPVKYLRRPNAGPAAARNTGIEAAQGDWIAFCDSDDVWDPEKLELEMAAIEATKAEWCISDFRLIDPDGKVVRSDTPGLKQVFPVLQETRVTPGSHFDKWLAVRHQRWGSSTVTVYHGDLYGMLFLGNVALPSTAVISRDLIDRAGVFDSAFRRGAEDTEFFHRLSTYGPGAIIMRPLASYRVGHPAMTAGDQAPFVEFALLSLREAALRRSPLTAKEKSAFRQGLRQLWLRLAYTRLTSLDGPGARRALYEGEREVRLMSPRAAAILVVSFLPRAALQSLHRAKQAIKRLVR